MFKVNKDTRTTSTVIFEHVIADWDGINFVPV